jgi:hypothetical protein
MNVLQHCPEPPGGTLPLALFPCDFNTAKFNQCLTARFGKVHSSRYFGCDCLFEVKFEFFFEFAAPCAKN